MAQPGSETEDMPRALRGACVGVTLEGTLVGCNGEHAQVLHVGISSAFALTSLGVIPVHQASLTHWVFLVFHPAVPVSCIGPCHEVCRTMGKVWVAHGGLSVSCCTPDGGWSIAYPCTVFPLGSPP